jgi:hypothetical protein
MKKISLSAVSVACFFMLWLPTNSSAFEPPVFDPPIEPPIIVNPFPIPFPEPDFSLTYDTSQITPSQNLNTSDSYIQTITMPFTLEGEDAGFLKIEYNRVNADYTNGTQAISFVTITDTFYLEDLIFYGKRRNKNSGFYSGKGLVQKIILESTNEVFDFNMSYYFNKDDKKINFFIQD